MRDPLLLTGAVLAALAGMGWLALAMEAHWPQVFAARGPTPRTATGLRVLGAAAIVISLLLCLYVDHATMAVLVWIMVLAGAALTIAFTLARRAHWLRVLLPLRRERQGSE